MIISIKIRSFVLCGLIWITHAIPAKAQDSSYTFLLTYDDIQTANLQNLEEAMSILPFFRTFNKDNTPIITYGSIGIENIAIFKDGFPAAMDQNINYDLRAIPLWDIERIEVHLNPFQAQAKNSSIVIHLFTKKIPQKPIWGQVNVTNTSLSDFHASMYAGMSNVVHSGQIGLSRSFTNDLYYNKGLRATSLGAFERYDMNLKYQYRILPSITLNISSDHSKVHTQNKGDIITGTSRVNDTHLDFNKHNLMGSLRFKASKFHTIVLDGMVHRFKNKVSFIDKDLNTGQQYSYEDFSSSPSTGYDQGLIKLALTSDGRPLNYQFGFELSNTKDICYPFINAVSTAYNDYSIYGYLSYQYRKSVILSGGLNLWHSNLTGNFILPRIQLKLAPKEVIELTISSHSSISYAPFTQVFYPTSLNNGVRNNILLDPIKQNVIHANVSLHQNKISAVSGMVIINQNNIPRVSRTNTYVSNGKSSNFSTYASLVYKNDYLTIKPSAMMHATNTLKDTGNLTFFYPELNLNTFIQIPKSKLSLGLTAKYIGNFTNSFMNNNIIYLNEQQKMRFLSARIQRKFYQDKLRISFGINNLLQTSFSTNNIYVLTEIDREFIRSEDIINSYPRTFTFKIQYTSL